MLDTMVAQPDVTPAPTDTVSTETTDTQGSTTADTNNDPFAVDESQFVSLTPEQRAALDPVLNKFRESAKTYAQKERESEGKKYSEHVKKAQALDRLVTDQRFVKWYQDTNNPQQTAAPKSVASAEEWAQAYQSLSNGDPLPMEQLQAKVVMSVGGPQLQKTQQAMQILQKENEMNKLFVSHPDAKDLDQIGREDNPDGQSLLELCMEVGEKRGLSFEQSYEMANRVSKSMENKGKRAAMGMVSEKKGSTTEKPSVNTRDEGVQFVDTMEEAMNKNIEAAMDGRKVTYRVKK
jgi:hypothetical protein